MKPRPTPCPAEVTLRVIGGRWKTPAENAAEAEAGDKKKQLALF